MATVSVLVLDDRVWVDCESLVGFLRGMQEHAALTAEQAELHRDGRVHVASWAVSDALRQVADGLVLTQFSAHEEFANRRTT